VSQILWSGTFHCVWLFFSPLHTMSMFVYFLHTLTKLPPFDQILRKLVPENVKCWSNKFWKVPDHKIWDTLRYLRFNDLAPLTVFDPICIASLLFIHSSSCHTLRELTKLYHTPSHSLLINNMVMRNLIQSKINSLSFYKSYINAMTISFIHLPVLKFTSSEKAMYISIFLP
jgi:hypothetical protein